MNWAPRRGALFGKKRQHDEHDFQKAVAALLTAILPHDAFFTSIDHAGGGRLQQAMKQGRGVKAGLADVWIVYRGKLHCLELKKPKGSTVSTDQRLVAEKLHAAGVSTLLAKNQEQVHQFLAIWKIPPRVAR